MKITRAHHYILDIYERIFYCCIEKYSKYKIQKLPLWKDLEKFTALTGCPGTAFCNFWSLYRYVRKNKPKEVLECGMGVSTVVLAYAIKENGFGRLTSMENHENYYENIVKAFPKDLKADLVLSSEVQDCYQMFRGVRYKEIPDRSYDFVFIDGPETFYEGEKTFDFDLIRIVEKSAGPVSALIDGRLSTSWVLKKIFGDRARFDWKRRQGIINNATKKDLLTTNQIIRRLGPHFI